MDGNSPDYKFNILNADTKLQLTNKTSEITTPGGGTCS